MTPTTRIAPTTTTARRAHGAEAALTAYVRDLSASGRRRQSERGKGSAAAALRRESPARARVELTALQR